MITVCDCHPLTKETVENLGQMQKEFARTICHKKNRLEKNRKRNNKLLPRHVCWFPHITSTVIVQSSPDDDSK
jgi:hypothetical protein